MRHYIGVVLAVGLAALLAGCGQPKGGDRVEVFPVTGEVFVDGNPAVGATVNLHKDNAPVPSTATVDATGKFVIATYGQADGAPKGTYKLTVIWPAPEGISGRLDGPDRLKERYADPTASEFVVEVVDAPVTVPKLELTAN
jgi:hypothetical protein